MKKAKKINGRQKGAQGEREFATVLKDLGIEARRGQQFSGGKDSPDVVADLTGVHFEVKRVQVKRCKVKELSFKEQTILCPTAPNDIHRVFIAD